MIGVWIKILNEPNILNESSIRRRNFVLKRHFVSHKNLEQNYSKIQKLMQYIYTNMKFDYKKITTFLDGVDSFVVGYREWMAMVVVVVVVVNVRVQNWMGKSHCLIKKKKIIFLFLILFSHFFILLFSF